MALHAGGGCVVPINCGSGSSPARGGRHSTWSGDGAPLHLPLDRERLHAFGATPPDNSASAGDSPPVQAPISPSEVLPSKVLVELAGWRVLLSANPITGQLLVQARMPATCPHQAASRANSQQQQQEQQRKVRCKLFRCCAAKGVPHNSGTNQTQPLVVLGGLEPVHPQAKVVNNPIFNNPKLKKIIGPSTPARQRRPRNRSRRRKQSIIHGSSSHVTPSTISNSDVPSAFPESQLSVEARPSDAKSLEPRLTFDSLPDELKLYIFGFLSPVDVLSVVPATCCHWKNLMQDETLWKVLHEEHFGGPRLSDRSWQQECVLALTRIKRQTQRYQTEMLMWGAKHGHTQFVHRMLREFNINANVRSHKSEASALHRAAAQGHYDMVELLLAHGADVNAKTSYGRTPLQQAARYGHAAVAQLLIFRGANVNAATEGGETPLLIAVGRNDLKLVKILLNNGADASAASAGFTAMRIATLQGNTEIVQLLQKHEMFLAKTQLSAPPTTAPST